MFKRITLAVLFVVVLSVPAFPVRSAPQQATIHTVSEGETWQQIAASYRTSLVELWQFNGVTNPARLEVGQRILLPRDVEAERTFQATGEPYWRVAVESGAPIYFVLGANGNTSPFDAIKETMYTVNMRDSIGVVAERPAQPTAAPPPTEAPSNEALPEIPEDALNANLMGIQGHFTVEDGQRDLLNMAAYDLNFGWAKQQVDWSVIEYLPDKYSVYLDTLDGFVNGAFDREMNVLLSFAAAPEWARPTNEEDGPPTDYEEFYNFMRFILGRYKGKVQAVEVWNEPNLRREWNGGDLNGAAYVDLLAGAYDAIKGVDPNIIVISAGLAPTGISNEIAIDDRVYFRQMYEAGFYNHADAIGIHPYGWANPPESRCCGDSGGVPSHNDHPSFYFLDTIEDYRAIQQEFGDNRPLWATEFGWGTMDQLGLEVPAEQPFFAYVDEQEQAQYIVDAFRIAQERDYMGPMFLWNLNVSALYGFDPNQAGYSILRGAIDRPRAAYQLLLEVPKYTPETAN